MADKSLCKIKGCGKPAVKRGMCNPHYNAWYRQSIKAKDVRKCAVDGCDRRLHAHSYCARHAWKFRQYGDPLAGMTTAGNGEPLRWIKENTSFKGRECLPWPFEVNKRTGYGTLKHDGVRRPASRAMCIEAHGPPPDGSFQAAHSCGNRICCNPCHLSWKTRTGNVLDSMRHGTWQAGNVKKATVLNPDLVRQIRRLAGTMRQKEIAALLGVSPRNVQKVIAGTNWAWVDNDEYIFRCRRSVGCEVRSPDVGGL